MSGTMQVREDADSAVKSSIEKQKAAVANAKSQQQESIDDLEKKKQDAKAKSQQQESIDELKQPKQDAAESGPQERKLVKQIEAQRETIKGEEHKLNALLEIEKKLPELYKKAESDLTSKGLSLYSPKMLSLLLWISPSWHIILKQLLSLSRMENYTAMPLILMLCQWPKIAVLRMIDKSESTQCSL